MRIRIRKDLMTEQNFDSKTIRYLYVSMIIAGLAFTGKIEGPNPKWTVMDQRGRFIRLNWTVQTTERPSTLDQTRFFRNKYLFVWPSIFSISSCYWHLCFTISSHIKKLSNINNLFEFDACWFQSQTISRWRRKTLRFTQACFKKQLQLYLG